MTEQEWACVALKLVNNFKGFIGDFLIAFVPVFLGVWLSVKMALQKFRTEKWWEQKAAAYDAIIEAVYHGFRFYDEALHAINDDGDVDQVKQEELVRNAREADMEIVRVMTIGTLKVSQAFLDRLKRFRRDENAADEVHDWSHHVLLAYDAHESCLDDLVRLAKEDLLVGKK